MGLLRMDLLRMGILEPLQDVDAPEVGGLFGAVPAMGSAPWRLEVREADSSVRLLPRSVAKVPARPVDLVSHLCHLLAQVVLDPVDGVALWGLRLQHLLRSLESPLQFLERMLRRLGVILPRLAVYLVAVLVRGDGEHAGICQREGSVQQDGHTPPFLVLPKGDPLSCFPEGRLAVVGRKDGCTAVPLARGFLAPVLCGVLAVLRLLDVHAGAIDGKACGLQADILQQCFPSDDEQGV
mmetsp:Transcript_82960/g.256509  ORF Transcript_82960/g.256509 Transcript_82960/m.256509 type:complete len:238 (-) Transcript_82960:248-961(-)